jgi:hypothetical protein
MKKMLIVASVSVLAGCASTTGVVPMGQGTYMVSRHDNGPAASMGSVKVAALNEAGEFCQDKGGDYQVLSSNDVPRSLGQFPQVSLQFRCVTKAKQSP